MPVGKTGKVYNTQAWRRVCALVKKRDGYRCRKCGRASRERGGTARLTVQHVRSERMYPYLALEPSNLITLCDRCHGRADGGRRYK